MHLNNGSCSKCREIAFKYAGFDQDLWNWFQMIQAKFPDFHMAEAGRGHIEQELAFNRGASHAHWGESAHNYNAAFDGFWLVNGKYSLDERLFDLIQPEIPSFIIWYGAPSAPFRERPHYQKFNWRELASKKVLKLVENYPIK